MKTSLLWLLALLLAKVSWGADRPNILFILTDDHGWPTLGCYGSNKVPTPHLDRLAGEGMRFSEAYVMPQCTPTRAALLSGQHTARNGMWHVIPWYGLPWARVEEPGYREQFPRDLPNLPKSLHDAGYTTGMAGKWHLTTGADGDYVSLHPEAAGAYGFDWVAPRGPGSQNEGDKWVDHLTDQAIGFIQGHHDKPWFFYLAHHTLHGVVAAPPDLVKKHLAAGAPETGMFNATYFAAIEHLDNSIGRLLGALDEMNLRNNTLVVFLSDNGGLDTNYHLPEVNDGSRPLRIKTQEFDNAPLRAGKGSAYEGGIRMPCLVRWPGHVSAGRVCDTPVHVVDWMPTLLAASGASSSGNHRLDGVNLLPLFDGETIAPRPLFWYLPLYDLRWAATPCAVIRQGDWKLIESFGDWFDEETRYHVGPRLELFNLREDPGELVDQSASESVRAADLRSQLRDWMRSIPVPIPGDNPHFEPTRQLEETKVKPEWLK
ncbi:MAG: sulfatase [Verrucomicrobiales bacterium]|nr:sulfatase [Verrucomicrobiales bacterium]